MIFKFFRIFTFIMLYKNLQLKIIKYEQQFSNYDNLSNISKLDHTLV